MGIADTIKQLDSRDAARQGLNDLKNDIGVLVNRQDGLSFVSEAVCSFDLMQESSEYTQVKTLIDETISLIKKDRWTETRLEFKPEKVKFNSLVTYGEEVRCKIKAPNENVYLVCIGSQSSDTYYVSAYLKHRFFNPYRKQASNLLRDRISNYYLNLKKHLYGSQKYVSNNNIILFDDGYYFVRSHDSFPYLSGTITEKQIETVQYHFAQLVREVNK